MNVFASVAYLFQDPSFLEIYLKNLTLTGLSTVSNENLLLLFKQLFKFKKKIVRKLLQT